MRTTDFDALLFSLKVALAGVLALLVYQQFHLASGGWAAPVSAVIVLQPGLSPSMKASLLRVWANLLGALIGSLFALILGDSIGALALGLLVTTWVCHFGKLDDFQRPAYVAVLIVILTSKGSIWVGSLDRVLAVIIGCGVSLLICLVFDRLLAWPLLQLRNRLPLRSVEMEKTTPTGKES